MIRIVLLQQLPLEKHHGKWREHHRAWPLVAHAMHLPRCQQCMLHHPCCQLPCRPRTSCFCVKLGGKNCQWRETYTKCCNSLKFLEVSMGHTMIFKQMTSSVAGMATHNPLQWMNHTSWIIQHTSLIIYHDSSIFSLESCIIHHESSITYHWIMPLPWGTIN